MRTEIVDRSGPRVLSASEAAALRLWLAYSRASCRTIAITARDVSLITTVAGEEIASTVIRSGDLYVDLVRAHRNLLGTGWWSPTLT